MQTVITYVITLVVIVISVFITLLFKVELEKMFREKKEVTAFHICNVVIVLMVAFMTNAVFTIYIMENEFNMLLQLVILFFIILPIYLIGYLAFEKYKITNRKYVKAENGKVLIINERFLNRK
ncbi:hypothetical protein [Bacillus dakarensis]|uniref:hypothetical protein n=1 Tax=Robertmurraya dakarensis TaxID=1926278 RepID=UPI0009824E85|nr:hypothetical protein [Bacillus dakarensis]